MFRKAASRKIVNLKLYDIDGCLYHGARGLPEENIQNWLIETNQQFFDDQVAEIKQKKCTHVYVGFGTNRGDIIDDAVNADMKGTTSAMPALPVTQSYLAKKLGDKFEVKLDPFMMADIYGTNHIKDSKTKEIITPAENKKAGDSYEAILRHKYQNSQTENHARWVFDETKISLIYAHMQRVYKLNQDADEIIVDFYEDRPEILKMIRAFFENNKHIFDKKIVLRTHLYDGGKAEQFGKDIRGEGHFDPNYDWSVRLMAAMNYHFSGLNAGQDRKISSSLNPAEGLQAYYDERRYYLQDGREMKMSISPGEDYSDFNVETFTRIRDEEIIPKLKPDTADTPKNYTTAFELCEKGLIPERLVLDFNEAKKKAEKASNVAKTAKSVVKKSADIKRDIVVDEKLPILSKNKAVEKEFAISEEAHNEILSIMADYIESRANHVKEEKGNNIFELNWSSRNFRDQKLSAKKIKCASEFIESVDAEVENKLSFSRLNEMTYEYLALIKSLDKEHKDIKSKELGRPYFLFKSDLIKSLEKIKDVLNSEKKNYLRQERKRAIGI